MTYHIFNQMRKHSLLKENINRLSVAFLQFIIPILSATIFLVNPFYLDQKTNKRTTDNFSSTIYFCSHILFGNSTILAIPLNSIFSRVSSGQSTDKYSSFWNYKHNWKP